MKAIVLTRYGSPDVLQFEEVEKPAAVGNQVLVKVHAASANPLDWHGVSGKPFIARLMGSGILKPKDPRVGADVAGREKLMSSSPSRTNASTSLRLVSGRI